MNIQNPFNLKIGCYYWYQQTLQQEWRVCKVVEDYDGALVLIHAGTMQTYLVRELNPQKYVFVEINPPKKDTE